MGLVQNHPDECSQHLLCDGEILYDADSPVPLELVHWRFLLDEHIAPLESPLLSPERRLQSTVRDHHLRKARQFISTDLPT